MIEKGEIIPNRHSHRLEDLLIVTIKDFGNEFEISHAEVVGCLELLKSRYVNRYLDEELQRIKEER